MNTPQTSNLDADSYGCVCVFACAAFGGYGFVLAICDSMAHRRFILRESQACEPTSWRIWWVSAASCTHYAYLLKSQLFNFLRNMGYMSVKG